MSEALEQRFIQVIKDLLDSKRDNDIKLNLNDDEDDLIIERPKKIRKLNDKSKEKINKKSELYERSCEFFNKYNLNIHEKPNSWLLKYKTYLRPHLLMWYYIYRSVYLKENNEMKMSVEELKQINLSFECNKEIWLYKYYDQTRYPPNASEGNIIDSVLWDLQFKNDKRILKEQKEKEEKEKRKQEKARKERAKKNKTTCLDILNTMKL